LPEGDRREKKKKMKIPLDPNNVKGTKKTEGKSQNHWVLVINFWGKEGTRGKLDKDEEGRQRCGTRDAGRRGNRRGNREKGRPRKG